MAPEIFIMRYHASAFVLYRLHLYRTSLTHRTSATDCNLLLTRKWSCGINFLAHTATCNDSYGIMLVWLKPSWSQNSLWANQLGYCSWERNQPISSKMDTLSLRDRDSFTQNISMQVQNVLAVSSVLQSKARINADTADRQTVFVSLSDVVLVCKRLRGLSSIFIYSTGLTALNLLWFTEMQSRSQTRIIRWKCDITVSTSHWLRGGGWGGTTVNWWAEQFWLHVVNCNSGADCRHHSCCAALIWLVGSWTAIKPKLNFLPDCMDIKNQ